MMLDYMKAPMQTPAAGGKIGDKIHHTRDVAIWIRFVEGIFLDIFRLQPPDIVGKG